MTNRCKVPGCPAEQADHSGYWCERHAAEWPQSGEYRRMRSKELTGNRAMRCMADWANRIGAEELHGGGNA